MMKWYEYIMQFFTARPLIFIRAFLVMCVSSTFWSFISYRTLHHYSSNMLQAKAPKRIIRAHLVERFDDFTPVNRTPRRLKNEALKYARTQGEDAKSVARLYSTDQLSADEQDTEELDSLPKSRRLNRNATRGSGESRAAPAGDAKQQVRLFGRRWEPRLMLPLEQGSFYVSSHFGLRRLGGKWGFHRGIDFAAPTGTPVKAARNGRVITAGWHPGKGNHVIIDHSGGMRTCYYHMSKICAREGQIVSSGRVIGKVGATGFVKKRVGGSGSHLHFQVEIDGVCVNPRLLLPYIFRQR